MKQFHRYLIVTKADGTHTGGHVNYGGCKVAKNILLMINQDELETFWDHVGRVEKDDTFEATLRKVKRV